MASREKQQMRARDYRCSFCGKAQSQVKRLIAGSRNVFICDECIDLCHDIVHEESEVKKSEPGHRVS